MHSTGTRVCLSAASEKYDGESFAVVCRHPVWEASIHAHQSILCLQHANAKWCLLDAELAAILKVAKAQSKLHGKISAIRVRATDKVLGHCDVCKVEVGSLR